MGLGIISSEDFESELKDCVSNQSLPITTSVIPRAFEIPSEDNPIDISDKIPQTPAEVITANSEARGRGISNTQVPSALRKVIGETSVINGRRDALELAELFDVSPSSVSAYKKGAHSTASINEPNKDTLAHINASKLRVTKRATRRLNLALTHITEDKLLEAKVGEIASVAKSMAGIIKDMQPEDSSEKNKSNIPFVVFAPIVLKESHFETVYAKDDY